MVFCWTCHDWHAQSTPRGEHPKRPMELYFVPPGYPSQKKKNPKNEDD